MTRSWQGVEASNHDTFLVQKPCVTIKTSNLHGWDSLDLGTTWHLRVVPSQLVKVLEPLQEDDAAGREEEHVLRTSTICTSLMK